MILELELLEQCDGDPLTYALMERKVFGGNRARLLNIIKHHHREGYLDARLAGLPIAPWQIDVWLRLPHAAATEADLQQVMLETTARGANHVYDGSC
jgi:truncated hemoglobin YjbI